jgi:hypothetical protein
MGFVQPFAVKIYEYVTGILDKVVFVSVSLMLPVPEEGGLLIPATAARVQLILVPETEEVGE